MCKAPRVSLGHPNGRDRLRVAVDATPLLGTRTGVGRFCEGALGALAMASELDMDEVRASMNAPAEA